MNETEELKQEIKLHNYYRNYLSPSDHGRVYGDSQDPKLDHFGYSKAELYFLDPQVTACFLITCFSVLNKKGVFEEISEDNKRRDIKKSKEMADFFNFTLKALDRPFDGVMYDLMTAKWFGKAFLELVYDVIPEGKYKNYYYYRTIKGRRPGLWAPYKNDYGNLDGFISGLFPGKIFPKSKFLFLSWLPLFNNLHGVPDFSKTEASIKIKKEFLIFIAALGARQSHGKQTILKGDASVSTANRSEITSILRTLTDNLSAYVPKIYDVDFQSFDNKALEYFLAVVSRMDTQIATAMLGNSLTTNQNESTGSLAMAKVQQESGTYSFTDYAVTSIESLMNKQFMEPLIRLNFDPKVYPPEIWPSFKLITPEHTDKQLLAKLMIALKTIGVLDPDTEIDFNYLRRIFDLPDNLEALLEKEAAKEAANQEEDQEEVNYPNN